MWTNKLLQWKNDGYHERISTITMAVLAFAPPDPPSSPPTAAIPFKVPLKIDFNLPFKLSYKLLVKLTTNHNVKNIPWKFAAADGICRAAVQWKQGEMRGREMLLLLSIQEMVEAVTAVTAATTAVLVSILVCCWTEWQIMGNAWLLMWFAATRAASAQRMKSSTVTRLVSVGVWQ